MTASLLATVAALAISLPIFTVLELVRERRSRRLSSQYTSSNRKETP